MECPVCYTSKAKYKLVCDHSFCYQCISRWYQECGNHTCPLCRQDLVFKENVSTREVHIQCTPEANLDDYNSFQELLEKYAKYTIKDVEYLRQQSWVRWVTEHRAKDQIYTNYIFHGLQGTQKASYQKRQKEQKAGVLTKTHKD